MCSNCNKTDGPMITIQPLVKPNGVTIDVRTPCVLCLECHWKLMDAGFKALQKDDQCT